jgi:D-alanyl-D-alanine carboxypeptidase/D-alanyl-D-alanine-endopeptidase (penicillin-binding protein 4)
MRTRRARRRHRDQTLGPFRRQRIAAKGLTSVLRYGARDRASLGAHLATSIAGVDGTLKNRLTRFADRRSIRAKSGTLASVIALSGYVLGPDGKPAIAFSFMVDAAKGKTGGARAAIDDAVAELAGKLY